MGSDNKLAFVTINTSKMEEKIKKIISLLPPESVDKFLTKLLSLTDDVMFSNYSGTVQTGVTDEIVYFIDFDNGFYSKILSTARALNADITHNSVP
ncbi:hypothetical protein IS513_06695 [Proteus mirabilis]|uniref:hypothetical protein n=1 Tax=Proteus mirabilis TaxID=584 RepID=UPI0009AC1F16|nr:hypothetical protein [Proteus mirabilis]ARA23101.1 hypothetical protein AM438_11630 [Proteus mirabilis]MBO8263442.1 hypothetical protein [Proteus mirabilis]MBO8266752.1 hypothetical protein [Proteus mirabilis]MBO8271058.1 hypothetical protein [Proteus mirabilis]MBO8274648.1 hypothetical protein [Proteus mirabilis]